MNSTKELNINSFFLFVEKNIGSGAKIVFA
jgi:hypothetical protein